MNSQNYRSPLCLAATLTIVAALTACKGDEPTPQAPPTAESSPATAPGTVGLPVADKKTITARLAPPDNAVPPSKATSKQQARQTPSGPLQPMTLTGFDPAVVTVVGTPSPDALIKAFFALARRFGVTQLTTNTDAVLSSLLGGELNARNMDWVDLTGPAKLVVPDPKRWPDGFALVLKQNGDLKALATAFGDRYSAAPGHACSLGISPGRLVFVDELDGNVVFTSHTDLFEQLKAYLAGPVAAWTPTQPLAVEIDNSNLKRIYADDLQAAKGLLGAVGANIAGRAADPAQAETMRAMVDSIFDVVDEAKRISLVVDPAGTHARIGLGMTAEPGSTTAGVIAALKAAHPSNVDAVSPESWFALASRIDLWEANEAELADRLYASTRGQQFTLTKSEAAELAKHIVALSNSVEADSAFSIGEDAQFPFAVTAVSGLKQDPATAKRALTAMLDVFFRKVVAEGTKSMGAEDGVANKIDGPTKLLEMIKPLLGPLGLAVELVDTTKDGIALQGVTIDFDWNKLKLNARDPELDALLKRVIGKRLEIAVAYGPKHISFGLGPRAFALAKNTAGGGKLGGDPNLNRVASRGFGGVSIRIGKALQALDFMPRLKSKTKAIAALPAAEAFTMSATSDGAMMTMEIEVAVDLLKGLMNIQ